MKIRDFKLTIRWTGTPRKKSENDIFHKNPEIGTSVVVFCIVVSGLCWVILGTDVGTRSALLIDWMIGNDR